MAKVPPFHSKLRGTSVHRNNSSCTEGKNIEARNRVQGTRAGFRSVSTASGWPNGGDGYAQWLGYERTGVAGVGNFDEDLWGISVSGVIQSNLPN